MKDDELKSLADALVYAYTAATPSTGITARDYWDDKYTNVSANIWQNEVQHAISGKAYIATHSCDEFANESLMGTVNGTENIKRLLAAQLVDALIKNKGIEFTSQQDMASGIYHYRARLFATPDEQVRILREIGQFNP